MGRGPREGNKDNIRTHYKNYRKDGQRMIGLNDGLTKNGLIMDKEWTEGRTDNGLKDGEWTEGRRMD